MSHPPSDETTRLSPVPGRENPAPSSTGLTPQVAGALAYLAGPFLGALLLATEDSSRFVKFHAWQAIIGLGALLENGRNASSMAMVFEAIILILFVGIAIDLLIFSPLERHVLRGRGLLVKN